MEVTENNKYLVSCDDLGYITKINIRKGEMVKIYQSVRRGNVWGARLIPDSFNLVINVDKGCFKVLSIREDRFVRERIRLHQDFVNSMTVSTDGQWLFTGDGKGCLKMFALKGGEGGKSFGKVDEGVITNIVI
jgi:WD40 repeat protein